MESKNKTLLEQIAVHYSGMYAKKLYLMVVDLEGKIEFVTHALAHLLRINPYTQDKSTGLVYYFSSILNNANVLLDFEKILPLVIATETTHRFFFNATLEGVNYSHVLLFSPIFSPQGEVVGIELKILEYNFLPIKHYLDFNIEIHSRAFSASGKEIYLTPRQNDIVFYLFLGYTQREIAAKLQITRGTVSKIISEQICPKFAVSNGYTASLLAKVLESSLKLRLPNSMIEGARLRKKLTVRVN